MKKICLVLLAVLLMIPGISALAAEAEYQTYTNANDGYQISFPVDWLILDQQTIGAVFDLAVSGELEGIDMSELEAYKPQIEAFDMMMALSPRGDFNVNVIYQEIGVEVSLDDVLSMYLPVTLTQLEQALPGSQVVEAGAKMTCGEMEYAYCSLLTEVGGFNMIMNQLYSVSGTKMYISTYTLTLSSETDAMTDYEAVADAIAASLIPA